jgi:SAM-dependent methyltransferase
VEAEAYLGHETWIRPAFQRLGSIDGRRVLDLGCGHGMAAVVLARGGAHVTALDVSGGYLTEATWRAHANAVAIDFVQADAEKLPFANGTFDRVWGNAVLHHLDRGDAAREVARVLRPDGIAVFCEPWGENPLLNWSRNRRHHTPDEEPLRRRDLRILGDAFGTVDVASFQLLGMARRFLGQGRIGRSLDWCDEKLMSWLPAFRRYCRYVVVTLRH